MGANPPPSPNKHSLFVFLPTPRRSLFVSPPDGCRSSISLHSDNLRNSSCPHFRPPSPRSRLEAGARPGRPGRRRGRRRGSSGAHISRVLPGASVGAWRGTARSVPPGREAPGAPGAHPHRGGCGAEATLGEVEARGARGRVGRTGRSSAADLTGAPARPIR